MIKNLFVGFLKNFVFIMLAIVVSIISTGRVKAPDQIRFNQALNSGQWEKCRSVRLDWMRLNCLEAVQSRKVLNCKKFSSGDAEAKECIRRDVIPSNEFNIGKTHQYIFIFSTVTYIIVFTFLFRSIFFFMRKNYIKIIDGSVGFTDYLMRVAKRDEKLVLSKEIKDVLIYSIIGVLIHILFFIFIKSFS